MKPFDPKCLELAEYFMQEVADIQELTREERTRLLALSIQEAVEDFLT